MPSAVMFVVPCTSPTRRSRPFRCCQSAKPVAMATTAPAAPAFSARSAARSEPRSRSRPVAASRSNPNARVHVPIGIATAIGWMGWPYGRPCSVFARLLLGFPPICPVREIALPST